jgi:hypothetical protein
MHFPIYLIASVTGLCSLWFLWIYGIRPLFLDWFRERLFELRFEVFELGMNGDLLFDGEAYRTFETLLNALLRFAHRITVPVYLLSKWEQDRAKLRKDYVDVAQQIDLSLSRLDSQTAERLTNIIKNVHSAIIFYMAVSSLSFLALLALYAMSQLFGTDWHSDRQEKMVAVIEREAFFAETRPKYAQLSPSIA